MIRSLSLTLALLFSVCSCVRAQSSIFDLVAQQGDEMATTIILETELDSIYSKARAGFPGTFKIMMNSGQELALETEVSLRGKFRRSRCHNAPIKIDFGKKELEALGLTKFDKYKLVTRCNEDETAEQLLIKEYLAYRIYQIVTPNSFRVRLLNVVYRDTNGNHPERREHAFMIEETDEMAARIGGKEMEDGLGLSPDDFVAEAEALHAMVQYLLGNADYSLPLQRNVKFVRMTDGKIVPVGYDFDFSGLVGAPYASPTREVGQHSIYQRVYLGYAQPERTLRNTMIQLRSNRRDILKLIRQYEGLDDTDRTRIVRFINNYYGAMIEMESAPGAVLYDQLRGTAATLIPVGGQDIHFSTRSARVR